MAGVFTTLGSGLRFVLRALCVVLFAALVLLVCWQVFSRLVLGQPSAWSEEAARYTFVWVSLIGISIAVGEKADVVMEILVERLPFAAQRVCDILAYVAGLAFSAFVMVYGGLDQVERAWTALNPVLPLTQGQLYLALPISGVLLSLFFIGHIGHAFSRSYRGRAEVEVDEAAAL